MADNGDTGAGTTLTLSGGFTAYFREIDSGEQRRDAIEDTHLASTKHTYMPGDLEEPGELTGEFFWDQSFSTFPSTDSTPQTVTETYPLNSASRATPRWWAPALSHVFKGPVARVGDLMMGSLTVKWDGKTGPTYTAGS